MPVVHLSTEDYGLLTRWLEQVKRLRNTELDPLGLRTTLGDWDWAKAPSPAAEVDLNPREPQLRDRRFGPHEATRRDSVIVQLTQLTADPLVSGYMLATAAPVVAGNIAVYADTTGTSLSDSGAKPADFEAAGAAAAAVSGHELAYDHDLLHDPATVSGDGISITGQEISLDIGTSSGEVAAGNHNHKLDDLSAPDDNTDLDASITRHGLLKKLSNVATEWLNGVGSWVTIRLGDLAGVNLTGLGDGDVLAYELATTTWKPVSAGGGAGDFVGPVGATSGNFVSFGDATGKLGADSGKKAADFELVANKNAASGYAGLNASSKLTGSQQVYGTLANTACEGNDARLSDDRDPNAHNTTHQSGGSDAIKLDDLAAPDDTTDLDASITKHGLLKKLSNVATEFMSGIGSWVTIRLGDLAGVDLTGLGNGDVLAYELATTTWKPVAAGGGAGDVVGPAGATDGYHALFDGVTGKLLKVGGAPSAKEDAGVAAGLITTHEAAADPHPQYQVDGLAQARQSAGVQHSDFYSASAPGIDPYTGTAIATGSISTGTPDANHPGVVIFRSNNSNADSGYNLRMRENTIVMAGGEVCEAIFTLEYTTSLRMRFGLMNGVTAGTPTSGAWIYVSGTTVDGRTADGAGNSSTTATNYAASASTWYRARVEVNAAASLITFTLYTADGTQVWQDTLATDLPGSGDLLYHPAIVAWCPVPFGVTRQLSFIDWMASYCTRVLVR